MKAGLSREIEQVNWGHELYVTVRATKAMCVM